MKALTSQRIAQGQLCVKNSGSGTNNSCNAGRVSFSAPLSYKACSRESSFLATDPRIITHYRSSSPSESSVSSTRSTSSITINQASINQTSNAPLPTQPTSRHRPQHIQMYSNNRGISVHGSKDDINSKYTSSTPAPAARGGTLTVSELKELTKQRLQKEQQVKMLSQLNSAQAEFDIPPTREPYPPPVPPGHRSHLMPSPPAALPPVQKVYDHNDFYASSLKLSRGFNQVETDTMSESSVSVASSENTQSYASAPMMRETSSFFPQNARTDGVYCMDHSELTSHSDRSSVFDAPIDVANFFHERQYPSYSQGQLQKQQSSAKPFHSQTISADDSYRNERCMKSASDVHLDEVYASVPTMQVEIDARSSLSSHTSSHTSSISGGTSAVSGGIAPPSLFNRSKLCVAVPSNIRRQAIEESISNTSGEGFMKSKEGGRMFRKSLLGFLESDSELDDSCHSLDYSRHSLDRSRRSLDRSKHSLDGSRHSVSKISKSLAGGMLDVSGGQDDELRLSVHSSGSRCSSGHNSPHKSKKSLDLPSGLLSSVFSVSSDKTVNRDPLDVSHHVNR